MTAPILFLGQRQTLTPEANAAHSSLKYQVEQLNRAISSGHMAPNQKDSALAALKRIRLAQVELGKELRKCSSGQ